MSLLDKVGALNQLEADIKTGLATSIPLIFFLTQKRFSFLVLAIFLDKAMSLRKWIHQTYFSAIFIYSNLFWRIPPWCIRTSKHGRYQEIFQEGGDTKFGYSLRRGGGGTVGRNHKCFASKYFTKIF